MRAVVFAPPASEGEAVAAVLEAGGYDVELIGVEELPAGEPDVAVVIHDRSVSWAQVRQMIDACGGAVAVYVGSRPREAERQVPRLDAALPRPFKSVELRAELQRFGLPWGRAPAHMSHAV